MLIYKWYTYVAVHVSEHNGLRCSDRDERGRMCVFCKWCIYLVEVVYVRASERSCVLVWVSKGSSKPISPINSGYTVFDLVHTNYVIILTKNRY